jgi:propionyl-CoA carboxylase alpha chain
VTFDDANMLRVASSWTPAERVWTGSIDGRRLAFGAKALRNGRRLTHGGDAAEARVYPPRVADLAAGMPRPSEAEETAALLCPMPGLLKTLYVVEGQAVARGEPICLVEAMKTETTLRAEHDLVVRSIEARPGESLAVDALIVTFA